MSVSARSLLIPGMALATAGALALTPAMTTAPMAAPALPAAAVPSIHIEEIQLAGIGREIYDSITNFVQYTVSSAEFWIDLIPIIGPPLADQLYINYFEGIQPLIAATVYVISDIIADPFNFLPLAVAYGENLFYTGYNWFSAQLQFFGLPGLLPIPVPPPLASVSPAGRGAAAVVEAPAIEAPAIFEAPVIEGPAAPAPEAVGVTEAPTAAEAAEAVTVRPDARGRAARANAEAPRPARVAAAAEATAPAAAGVDAETAEDADGPQRGSAKAARAAARAAR